jgi:signal transduction histidine kinase
MRRRRSILVALILTTLVTIFATINYQSAVSNTSNFRQVTEQSVPALVALKSMQNSAATATLKGVNAAIRVDEIHHRGDDNAGHLDESEESDAQKTFYANLETYAALTEEPALAEQIEQSGTHIFDLTTQLKELKIQGVVGDEILDVLDELEAEQEKLDQVINTAMRREEVERTKAIMLLAHSLASPQQIGITYSIALILVLSSVLAADRFNAQRQKSQQRIEGQNKALVKANRELAVARKQAEEASRLKDEFLANMSHELRTPLNAIIGYTQIILHGISGELNSRQRMNMERILYNSENLLALINDVLDVAKIEAGRMEIVRRPFELRSWADRVTTQMSGLAEKKQLDYRVVVDQALPEEIVGDVERLKQILLNLISNAIKFTEKGGVTVRVEQCNQEHWAISVADTGIGIPAHAIEYIFDEFRQVDGSKARQFGGTGLGLAIVRNLTLMMDGKINVTSELGEGSIFTVTLPLITRAEDGVSEKTRSDSP